MKDSRTHISWLAHWRRKRASREQTDAKFTWHEASQAVADHVEAHGVTAIEPIQSPKRRRSTILTVKRS